MMELTEVLYTLPFKVSRRGCCEDKMVFDYPLCAKNGGFF